MKKIVRLQDMMKGIAPPKIESDLFKYIIVPLTPGHIDERLNLEKESKGKFLKVNKERQDVYEKRLFTLVVCAFLRIIYNMLNNMPNEVNS